MPGSGGASGGVQEGTGGGSTNPAEGCDVRLPAPEKQYALWPMSTPTGSGLAHPESYVADEETVFDEVTGLMWQRGHSEAVSPPAAVDYCAELELSGHCDWRVPSRIEIASLMNPEEEPPVAELLEDAQYSLVGWGSEGERWAATIAGDLVLSAVDDSEQFNFGVRCVRAPRPTTVTNRTLTLEGEGEDRVVVDSGTGLRWKHSDPVVELPHPEAAPHCAALTGDGGGFRSPTGKELLTIFDDAHEPSDNLDPQLFPLSDVGWHQVAWTLPQQTSAEMWLVNFTIRQSYRLSSQLTVVPEQERLVFCVK